MRRLWPIGGLWHQKVVVVVVVAAAVAVTVVVAVKIAIAAITAVLICRLNQPTNFPIVTQKIMHGAALETGHGRCVSHTEILSCKR